MIGKLPLFSLLILSSLTIITITINGDWKGTRHQLEPHQQESAFICQKQSIPGVAKSDGQKHVPATQDRPESNHTVWSQVHKKSVLTQT